MFWFGGIRINAIKTTIFGDLADEFRGWGINETVISFHMCLISSASYAVDGYEGKCQAGTVVDVLESDLSW